jgi:hypothetical protein
LKNIKFFPDPDPQQWLIGEFDRLRLSYGTRHWLPYRYYLFTSSCPASGGPSGHSTGCRPRVWNRRIGHTSGQQGEEACQNIIFFCCDMVYFLHIYKIFMYFNDPPIHHPYTPTRVHSNCTPDPCWFMCNFSPSFFSFLVVRKHIGASRRGDIKLSWKRGVQKEFVKKRRNVYGTGIMHVFGRVITFWRSFTQCCGSGSTGSTCFWASRIRIH